MKLVSPSAIYKTSYRAYIEELGDEERYPFPLDFEHENFAEMLQKIENFRTGVRVPEGYVPSTTLWLVEHGQLIGCTNIRHYLNDKIAHCGGHIGLGIRPSARGKGYSKWLLTQSIQIARDLGVQSVHVHCHSHNEPSKRMIIACGGKLDSEIQVADETISRFIVKE